MQNHIAYFAGNTKHSQNAFFLCKKGRYVVHIVPKSHTEQLFFFKSCFFYLNQQHYFAN